MTIMVLYSTATNVEIAVPVPADASSPNVRTSMGSATYAPENDALMWKIRSFPGGKVLSTNSKLIKSSLTGHGSYHFEIQNIRSIC